MSMKKEKDNDCISTRIEGETKRNGFISIEDVRDLQKARPAILLHSCCGPCSTAVVERLSGRYDITIFFYNPNITDRDEYEKRRIAQIDFIEKYNDKIDAGERIGYLEGTYDTKRFFSVVKQLENEPEGGKRCTRCFQLRLEKTAETASMLGFDTFGTTLGISPYKNFELIVKIGMQLGMRYGLTFLSEDFKKHGGYQRSIELSKQYNLYRQKYCGCSFSDKK
ncbi:MAG: epoxyqueuosine reductase QueH [Anaerovoracaceae bacterium]|jgi:predicted adenine nucleotide alpha hydrolase (AANH) superfamily ATPase